MAGACLAAIFAAAAFQPVGEVPHRGLPLSGRNLPPRKLVCTSPRMSSMLLGRALYSQPMPRLLELFLGTGSVGLGLGREVISLDLDPNAEPTICAHVCSWEPMHVRAGYFDMIWALPPCAEYSRALTRRPRKLEKGDRTPRSSSGTCARASSASRILRPGC